MPLSILLEHLELKHCESRFVEQELREILCALTVKRKLGVQKLTRSGLNGSSEEGLLKDEFAFFAAYKSPIPQSQFYLAKLSRYFADFS